MLIRCIVRLPALQMNGRFYSKLGPTDLKGQKVAAQKWLIRQHKDPYVKRAQQDHYRCRSAYKLMELDEKYSFLRPGAVVIDLGASPGAWSQVAITRVNALGVLPDEPRGRVISVDKQHMLSLEGSTILPLSDFTQDDVQERILHLLNTRGPLPSDGRVRLDISSDQTASKDISKLGIRKDILYRSNVATNGVVSDNFISVGHQRRADVLLSDMAPSPTGVKSLDHQHIIALASSVLRFSLVGLVEGGTCIVKLWQGRETDRLTESMRKCFTSVREVKPRASRADSSEIFILATNFYL